MTPVEPLKNAIGPKTAASTSPMPIKALVISSMDLAVASRGESPSSDMMRSTFSTTTMASSTSRPIASTIANMVSMLIENPNSPRTAKVPRMTTGTASVGISVARRFPRKRYITRNTSRTASNRVLTTSLIASFTNGVVSLG